MGDKKEKKKLRLNSLPGIFSAVEKPDQEKTREELIQELEFLRRSEVEGATDPTFTSCYDNIPTALFHVDLTGNFAYINKKFRSLSGFTPDDLLGKNIFRLGIFPSDTAKIISRRMKERLAGKPARDQELQVIRKDGRFINLNFAATVLKKYGIPVGFQIVARDVTDRARTEDQLKEWEEKYRTLIEGANEGIAVNQDGLRKFVNTRYSEMLGYSKEELINKPFLKNIYAPDRKFVKKRYLDTENGDTPPLRSVRIMTKDGKTKWFEFSSVPIMWEGKPAALSFATDVTERKHLEEQLLMLATHDSLTSLPNRRLLYDRFDIAMANAERKNEKIAVMSLDIDRFKTINDAYGHDGGDRVLIATAKRLTELLRKADTVARFGGDEFVLLVSGINQKNDAAKVAEKILIAFRQPLALKGHKFIITISIGVSLFSDDGKDIQTLLQRSDQALYWIKEHGRANFKIGTDEAEPGATDYSKVKLTRQ